MADKKISDLALLSATDLDTSTDYLPIVDPSEAAAADQNKRILVGSILDKAVSQGTLASVSMVTPLARAVRVDMTAAASGSTGISVANNQEVDALDGDFTVVSRFKIIEGQAQYIMVNGTYGSGTDLGVYVGKTSTGNIRALTETRFSAGVLEFNDFGSISGRNGDFITLAFTYNKQQNQFAASVDGVEFGSPWSRSDATSFVNTNYGLKFLGNEAGARQAAEWGETLFFNRELTSAELLDFAINGPAPYDIGTPASRASQVAIYESDFSSTVDGFVAQTGCTLTPNQDGIGGEDNWIEQERTGGGGGSCRAGKPDLIYPDAYGRVSIKFYNPDGVTRYYGVATREVPLPTGTQELDGFVEVAATSSATLNTTVRQNDSISTLWVVPAESDGTHANNVASGFTFYWKDVTVHQTGITGLWSAEDAQTDTGQVFDRINSNHAMLPASGATRYPQLREFQVRGTNAWSETHELQYITGFNQAVLPANAYIKRIVGVITSSGGSGVQDIIIGDGSDADRYVTITTGLAAGTTTFTLATSITDGTNLKLTVDPDATCTMSIDWTIEVVVLE